MNDYWGVHNITISLMCKIVWQVLWCSTWVCLTLTHPTVGLGDQLVGKLDCQVMNTSCPVFVSTAQKEQSVSSLALLTIQYSMAYLSCVLNNLMWVFNFIYRWLPKCYIIHIYTLLCTIWYAGIRDAFAMCYLYRTTTCCGLVDLPVNKHKIIIYFL